jgi:outer membrane protein TolC
LEIKALNSLRRFMFVGLFVAFATSASMAQSSASAGKNTSSPSVWQPSFRFTTAYSPRRAAPISITNGTRIDGLLRGGKLYLSISDAIVLALENNMDLVASRYDLPIADADVLRARAGGGTVPSFDPILSFNAQIDRNTPAVNPLNQNTILNQNTTTGNVSYTQGFASGTNLTVGFQNQRVTQNYGGTLVPTGLTSGVQVQITQHLLQGFGWNLNRHLIRIARNNRKAADLAFRNDVISIVSQIKNIYWDLVSAFDDVKVKQESVDLAKQTLDNTAEQVKVGTLGRVELARWESQLASAQQDLITSQTTLRHEELLMKTAINRNLNNGVLVDAAIVPTDTMSLPAEEPVVKIEELINDALQQRPDLNQSRIDLVNRDITKKAQRNALLPALDVFANSTTSGNRSDYWSAFGDVFSAAGHDRAVGLTLTIPLRNRSARADQIQGELQYRQAEVKIQSLQNQIQSDVRDAKFAVQQNRARVEAARKAVTYARESFEAEQAKYGVGMSTSVSVLQAQRDLTQAQSNLITAMSAYEKAHIDLDQKTGLTLVNNNVDLSDAESGQVQKAPQVSGVVPAG